MLGQGCPWKHKCEQYKRESTHWKNQYCDRPGGYKMCAEYPTNYGNKELQQQNANFKQGGGIGALIILGLMIYGACKLFGIL